MPKRTPVKGPDASHPPGSGRKRHGFELPFLLAGAFRAVIDELHVELAQSGHDQVRAIHGIALQCIGPNGASVSELGRALGVSKQAAAKTAASLEQLGYADRSADPGDARAWRLRRSQRGEEMLDLSAAIFERQHRRLAHQLGASRVRDLEDDLESMAVRLGASSVSDLPGWLR